MARKPANGVKSGRSTAATSPTSSVHPSPNLPPSSGPRIKISMNNPPPTRHSTRILKPRKTASDQRVPTTSANKKNPVVLDSDSDLTPEEDQDDDSELAQSVSASRLDEDEQMTSAAPRKGRKSDPMVTPRSDKGKARADSSTKKETRRNGSSTGKVTVTGPAGREKRRAVKINEQERRRARDAKFDRTGSPDFTPTKGKRRSAKGHESDSDSSYGDDESDHITGGLGHEDEDDEAKGLPDAFAGQDIEDLAYGAGPAVVEVEREALSGLWGDDEDDELFISHLSGSEVERQSQSTIHSDDDEAMSDSEMSSSSDDGLDEFGFPLPHSMGPPGAGNSPLVLMEAWNGEFVLVQPRAERSRSSRRGDRSSRTNGSVGGSTVTSTNDQMGLVIDPDAVDDSDGSSMWSGMSDEEDGDTTDSMAEEDMPMLDSPALQQLIDQQVGNAPSPMDMDMDDVPMAGPSIIVTDTETPNLSNSVTNTPNLAGPSAAPQTPAGPMMGTFHPTTSDPAQHAVIDGSKTATKSPFTHRRRSRKGRAESMSSARTSFSVPPERKRKSKNMPMITDPFSPFPSVIPKRARYTSIPGHPRYIKAQREFQERDSTPSDDGNPEIELEDMLETGLLHDLQDGGEEVGSEEHLRHLIRFDRVPVSAYLKRNFSNRGHHPTHLPHNHQAPHHHHHAMSSPMRGRGGAILVPSPGMLDETLAGPMGRMLVSPVLLPAGGSGGVEGSERRGRSRGMAQLQI